MKTKIDLEEIVLIQKCKKEDVSAQRIIFERYAPMMMAVCVRYIKNEQDAEELMLNGFQRFFKQIKKIEYRGQGSVNAWLRKIMVNECLMFLRKKNNFVLVAAEDEIAIEPAMVLDKLSADEIFKHIIQLPTGYLTIFNLFVLEEMTHKEIAAVLKISEGTSKSQLKKAKASLQQMILKEKNYGRQG